MTTKNYKRISRGKHAMPKQTAAERFSKPFEETRSGPLGFLGDVIAIMPAREDIPEEFKKFPGRTPFNRIQSRWFFGGLKMWPLKAKPGIDRTTALAHLDAIQRSWEPKPEHKSAAVAYLMSLWFEAPEEEKP